MNPASPEVGTYNATLHASSLEDLRRLALRALHDLRVQERWYYRPLDALDSGKLRATTIKIRVLLHETWAEPVLTRDEAATATELADTLISALYGLSLHRRRHALMHVGGSALLELAGGTALLMVAASYLPFGGGLPHFAIVFGVCLGLQYVWSLRMRSAVGAVHAAPFLLNVYKDYLND